MVLCISYAIISRYCYKHDIEMHNYAEICVNIHFLFIPAAGSTGLCHPAGGSRGAFARRVSPPNIRDKQKAVYGIERCIAADRSVRQYSFTVFHKVFNNRIDSTGKIEMDEKVQEMEIKRLKSPLSPKFETSGGINGVNGINNFLTFSKNVLTKNFFGKVLRFY